MNDELLYERDGATAIVTFNRPQARNAMTWAMYEGLVEVCERVDADDDVRVLILRGAGGKAFVAGTDIRQFQAFRTPQDGLDYERRVSGVVDRIERVQKPVIAAIEGYAVGGGAAIAMACDLRYCTPESRFGVPIARTLGNCLSMGNIARLFDLLGPARTKELVFRAKLITAQEALSAGLVNEIVEAERLHGFVQEIAAEIATRAPITIAVTKESIRRLQEHHRTFPAEDLIARTYTSDDFHEGVQAFLEKRKPVWRGR